MASISDDARERSKSVQDHWRTISWILDRYEGRIRNKWTILSEIERIEILDKVWPNMCPLHRPDVTAYMEIQIMKGDAEYSDYRKSFMWPLINKEDICKGKNFLIFLHSRGRYPPEVFAAQDLSTTWLGRNIDAIEMAGEKEPEGLFRLAWYAEEQRQKGEYSPDKSDEVALLLKVQEGILGFLYKCCIEILGVGI